jgi:hypothetical protein
MYKIIAYRPVVFEDSAQRVQMIAGWLQNLQGTPLANPLFRAALHFLRKGAPIQPPLIDNPKIKFSLFDSIALPDNRYDAALLSSYYRWGGASTTTLYKHLLEEQCQVASLPGSLFALDHSNYRQVLANSLELLEVGRVGASATSKDKVDNYTFSEKEFQGNLNSKQLCKKVYNQCCRYWQSSAGKAKPTYLLALKNPKLEKLNNLLTAPGFYDDFAQNIIQNLKKGQVSQRVQALLEKTSVDRAANRTSTDIIKLNRYLLEEIFAKICPSSNRFIQELNTIIRQSFQPGKVAMLDLTKMVPPQLSFKDKISWLRTMETELATVTKNYPDMSILIGAFLVTDEKQPVLYFPKMTNRKRTIIISILGYSGYRADIIKLLGSIGRITDHQLEKVLKLTKWGANLTPSTTTGLPNLQENVSVTDLQLLCYALQKSLQQAAPTVNKASLKLHYQVLEDLLTGLTATLLNELSPKATTDGYHCQRRNICKKLLENIGKNIHDLQGETDIINFRASFELIIEDLILILSVINPSQFSLKGAIEIMAIKLNEQIERKVAVFNSGMKSNLHILQGLQAQYAKKSFHIAHASDTYFEGRLLLKAYRKKGIFTTREIENHQVDDLRQIKSCAQDLALSGIDCFFVDIHPNDARSPVIFKHDINKIIQQLLANREPTKPLTVVIDTTMHLFNDDEVQTILQANQEAISQGQLNIVITQSLAKYASLGLDKCSAGAIIAYNNVQYWREFNLYLEAAHTAEPLSQEANLFLGFLLEKAGHHILPYVNLIRSQTKYLYQYAKTKEMQHQKGSVIQVATQADPGATYLGIYYDTFNKTVLVDEDGIINENIVTAFNYFIFDYIYLLAASKDLPLNQRSSFGFPSSNIGDCYQTIRLTTGLEDHAILNQYGEILHQLNQEVSKVYRDPQILHKLKEILPKYKKIKLPQTLQETKALAPKLNSLESYLDLLAAKLNLSSD